MNPLAQQLAPLHERAQRIEFRAMGSGMMAAVDAPDEGAAAALEEVPSWFEEWEQELSRFRPASALSKLNATAGSGVAVRVNATMWEVLQLAIQAAQSTGGLVTPTVLDALLAAGYGASFDTLHGEGTAGAGNSAVPAWELIRLDEDRWKVTLPAGVRLDFGGVAKGWAADNAAARLSAYGPALVDAGGDIAVSGPPEDGDGWPIGVEAPLHPAFEEGSQIALLNVASGGIATSGRDYRRWQQNGRERHHIIDPRSGQPATTDIVSATVVGPSAAAAEIAAKAVFLLGSKAGLDWLAERPTLAGLIVIEDGTVLHSSRLSAYLLE